MQQSMTLETLLANIIEQKNAKRDFVTSTQDNVRLIQDPETSKVMLVLLRNGAEELERLELMDHAHSQIASRLGIPAAHYKRFLNDHPDLVCHNVNALFEREPKSRMIRVLGNQVRAFMSERYARLDNYELMTDTLPALNSLGIEHQVMSSHVDEHSMNLKVIITDENFGFEIAKARGEPRIMRPGFRLSNSETGKGALRMDGFFFDSYCTNGCVFGQLDAFGLSHTHLGGKVIEGTDFSIISAETEKLRRDTIKSEIRDAMNALTDRTKVSLMASTLMAAANSEKCRNPVAAVELAIKELPLLESEKDGILETFIRDGDYSKYGLSAAITEQANRDTISYDRACELEDIGGKVIDLSQAMWGRFVHAEPQKIAA